MTNQDAELLKTIYQQMQLKDTDELLAIWSKNDRLEWSEEAFSIIHEILLERSVSIPPQNDHRSSRKHYKKVSKRRRTIPLPLIIIFSPGILVLVTIILIQVIKPGPDDLWLTALFFISMALFFFAPGFYFGYKGWFQSEQLKQKAGEILPNMKKSRVILYRLSTCFLPDRYIPDYFLFGTRFVSISCLIGGVKMILFLLQAL
jgi:hypothetical protein